LAEKKKYGLLEMDEETKKRLDRITKTKPFHLVDPEIKELVMDKLKGKPRIIDVHAHPYTKEGWKSLGQFRVHLEKYLYNRDSTVESISERMPTEDEWVQPFREMGVVTMPVAWDAETTMGIRPPYGPDPLYKGNTNDYIASLRDNYPDVIITAWGSVDPWKGKKALEEVERCVKELKLIGIKFQQVGQAFMMSDRQFYPLWDLCQDLRIPLQFHSGYTGMGSGAPGALGAKLKYTMNIIPDFDDVAADFPYLKMIFLHPAEGRDDDVCLVCMHKGNVYRETSGMWPEYYAGSVPHMWHEMNRRLRNKIMFGSEYNLYPVDGVLYQHLQLDYREGILDRLFYKNAIDILGEDMERVGVDLKEWKENLGEV
jgi:hypothetical protein